MDWGFVLSSTIYISKYFHVIGCVMYVNVSSATYVCSCEGVSFFILSRRPHGLDRIISGLVNVSLFEFIQLNTRPELTEAKLHG